MALVLMGLSSYSLLVTDALGVQRRIPVRKGQDVSQLGLSGAQLKELKQLTVRGPGRTDVPVFIEMSTEPADPTKHSVGGKISNSSMKAQSEVKEPKIEEPKAKDLKAEESKDKEEPTKKAPTKKSKKKK